MNSLARVVDLRNNLNSQGVTTADAQMADALAEASRAAYTGTGGRQFWSSLDTRYLSGSNERLFMLGMDLLSVTSIAVSKTIYQPTVFENVLVAGTDYTLWPRNAALNMTPYRGILFNPDGRYAAAPFGYDNIQIVGKWGYWEEFTAVMVDASPVTATVADGTTTTITASADLTNTVFIGDTIAIESEHLEVLAVQPGTSILCTRGINGTVAVAHSTKAISLRRFPLDIERAVRADAARYLWRAAQGFPEGGFREMWPAIASTLDSYRDPAGLF